MKKTIYLFATIALILMNTSCYDRDIIDSKEGVSLPPVTNLTYVLSPDGVATINWQIPSNIPSEVKRPLNANLQVYKYINGVLSPIRVELRSIPGEPTSVTYKLPTPTALDTIPYQYHAIIKLEGSLKEAVYGESSAIYSLGETVVLK